MKQITHLNIDIKDPIECHTETGSNIFALILSLCPKLVVLNFCDMFPTRSYSPPLFYLLRKGCTPSTLTKLIINMASLIDCFYLLDGRLKQLNTFIVQIQYISNWKSIPRNKVSTFFFVVSS